MTKPTWSDRALAVWALLGDRPLAYHPLLARALGDDIPSAIFLTQMIYWSDKGTWRPGWIIKTQAELYEETALTRYQQERARKKLKALKLLLEEKRGVPARLHFRVRFGGLSNLLAKFLEEHPDAISPECEKLANKDAGTSQTESEEPANQDAEKPQTISEISPENTLPQDTPEESATGADEPDIDEVFPETAKTKAETPEWQEPPADLPPDQAAEIGAPGASAGWSGLRQPFDLHPAYNAWKAANYRITFPHDLERKAIFEYAVLFSELFAIPVPMNNRDIGKWRVGTVQSIAPFAEDLKANGRQTTPQEIIRRARWGLSVLHARRELKHAYDFTITSPTSVANTLRVIAGDLRRMEKDLGLIDRLPGEQEILNWYARQPGQSKLPTGAALTQQSIERVLEGARAA